MYEKTIILALAFAVGAFVGASRNVDAICLTITDCETKECGGPIGQIPTKEIEIDPGPGCYTSSGGEAQIDEQCGEWYWGGDNCSDFGGPNGGDIPALICL
jgi:hypothetical protein